MSLARLSLRLSSRLIIARQLTSAMVPKAFICSAPVKKTLLNLNKFNFNTIRAYSSEEKLSKSQIEEKVLELLRNFDRVKENPAKPQVSLESHLMKDLGLDSLDQVEIIVQLEDTFGYEIPDSDYEKLNTPLEIVNYIQKRLAEV